MGDSPKIITCASFGGSGSSAITDLLKEFNNIYSVGDFEFTICQDYDGISDLEYHLVNNFHRLNCDEAIFRFKKLIKRLKKSYSIYIYDFEKISEEYLEELIQLKWSGNWYMQQYRWGEIYRLFNYRMPSIVRGYLLKFKKSDYELVPKCKQHMMCYSRPENDFYYITKKYINKLVINLKNVNGNFEYIAMDQLIPPTNTKRYINYFDDIKVIVIDRDPRDLYILNKLFWKEGWIPTENLKEYIEWFKINRQLEIDDNNDRVLRLRFEDLIFNYEETLNNILKFIGVKSENHIRKFEGFNPKVSIKNTNLWEKYNELESDIKIIENELYKYCYEK